MAIRVKTTLGALKGCFRYLKNEKGNKNRTNDRFKLKNLGHRRALARGTQQNLWEPTGSNR